MLYDLQDVYGIGTRYYLPYLLPMPPTSLPLYALHLHGVSQAQPVGELAHFAVEVHLQSHLRGRLPHRDPLRLLEPGRLLLVVTALDHGVHAGGSRQERAGDVACDVYTRDDESDDDEYDERRRIR